MRDRQETKQKANQKSKGKNQKSKLAQCSAGRPAALCERWYF
jgi:hypothetical protein